MGECYNESFNGKLRDELLDREIFYRCREAEVLIERWRRHYNTVRPHSGVGLPAATPEAMLPWPSGPAYAPLRQGQNARPEHGQVSHSSWIPDRGQLNYVVSDARLALSEHHDFLASMRKAARQRRKFNAPKGS